MLRDDSTPPPNPGARRLKFGSSTKLDPVANRIVPPGRGTGGDPTLGGATLEVYNSAGSGERVTVALPASGWSVLGADGFRFKASGAPVRSVSVKRDRIKVSGGGASFGYTLDEPRQGSVALRLVLGTGAAWCAEAGRPPFPPRFDVVDRFTGAKTPPPAVCPALP